MYWILCNDTCWTDSSVDEIISFYRQGFDIVWKWVA